MEILREILEMCSHLKITEQEVIGRVEYVAVVYVTKEHYLHFNHSSLVSLLVQIKRGLEDAT